MVTETIALTQRIHISLSQPAGQPPKSADNRDDLAIPGYQNKWQDSAAPPSDGVGETPGVADDGVEWQGAGGTGDGGGGSVCSRLGSGPMRDRPAPGRAVRLADSVHIPTRSASVPAQGPPTLPSRRPTATAAAQRLRVGPVQTIHPQRSSKWRANYRSRYGSLR